eukprot:TRINITY_DN10536_c0_g1_i2.p1 TRINITY_DN10536_c0_g1~~TRINITY_DN10536_c0_g1_i2.p1  ORF type:complete len:469 (+),score=107.27 TRINITY_DN10536_c0_g1_i2:90-1409(+)
MADKIPTYCKNRYKQIGPIGNGAQSSVYLVHDTFTNKEVVIKRIHIPGDPAEASKAQREVEIFLALKEHPRVVRFMHTFDEYEGIVPTQMLNIVMEHCSKGDLEQFIKERAEAPGGPQYLGPELLLRWADQLLQGVEHMHHAGYMHRDLKAANIFITEDMNIKLGDFGVSRHLPRGEAARTVVGTPWYMAPEVMNLNEKTGYDGKTDVWGIGCILYQICALRLPFPGPSLRAVMEQVMQNRPDELPGCVPELLREMVMRMLCSDPARRPSVEELRDQMRYASPQRGARFHAAASPAAEAHGAGADAAADPQGSRAPGPGSPTYTLSPPSDTPAAAVAAAGASSTTLGQFSVGDRVSLAPGCAATDVTLGGALHHGGPPQPRRPPCPRRRVRPTGARRRSFRRAAPPPPSTAAASPPGGAPRPRPRSHGSGTTCAATGCM